MDAKAPFGDDLLKIAPIMFKDTAPTVIPIVDPWIAFSELESGMFM